MFHSRKNSLSKNTAAKIISPFWSIRQYVKRQTCRHKGLWEEKYDGRYIYYKVFYQKVARKYFFKCNLGILTGTVLLHTFFFLLLPDTLLFSNVRLFHRSRMFFALKPLSWREFSFQVILLYLYCSRISHLRKKIETDHHRIHNA